MSCYNKKRTDFQVATAKWLVRRKLSTQMRIGRLLGRLFYYLPNKRKTIARINIGLCFPQHTKQQANKLLKQNLLSTGQGVIEMMAALWTAEDHVQDRFEVIGIRTGLFDAQLSHHLD